MITTLFDVKRLQGAFDKLIAVDPTVNDDSSAGYAVGDVVLSEATGGTFTATDVTIGAAVWVQDTTNDSLINELIISANDSISRYLNNSFAPYLATVRFNTWPPFYGNWLRPELCKQTTSKDSWFYSSDTISFATDTITSTEGGIVFKVGDCIFLCNSERNDSYYTVIAVTDTTIEVDRNFADDTELAGDNTISIYYVNFPAPVKEIAARMIQYDVYERPKHRGLASENVGSYSYSKETVSVGGLGYPGSIVSGLDMYRRVRFM